MLPPGLCSTDGFVQECQLFSSVLLLSANVRKSSRRRLSVSMPAPCSRTFNESARSAAHTPSGIGLSLFGKNLQICSRTFVGLKSVRSFMSCIRISVDCSVVYPSTSSVRVSPKWVASSPVALDGRIRCDNCSKRVSRHQKSMTVDRLRHRDINSSASMLASLFLSRDFSEGLIQSGVLPEMRYREAKAIRCEKTLPLLRF